MYDVQVVSSCYTLSCSVKGFALSLVFADRKPYSRSIGEFIMPMEDSRQRSITIKNTVRAGNVSLARVVIMRALRFLSIR